MSFGVFFLTWELNVSKCEKFGYHCMFDPPQLLHYFIDFNEFYIKFVAFEMLYWIEVAKILSQKILSNFLGPKVKGVPKFGILRVQTDGLCLWVTKTD